MTVQETVELIDSFLPITVCRRLQVAPLQCITEKSTILVGMVNTDDLRASDEIEKLLKLKRFKLEITSITKSDFEKKIDEYYQTERLNQIRREEKLKQMSEREKALQYDEKFGEDFTHLHQSENFPLIKLVNKILIHAVENNLEQIYIEAQEDILVIKGKKEGYTEIYFTLPVHITNYVINRIKIMANIDPKNPTKAKKIETIHEDEKVDFLVSIIPTQKIDLVSIDMIRHNYIKATLEEYILNSDSLSIIRQLIHLSSGLIIISGESKTRKTTLSYLILKELSKQKLNIYTLEKYLTYEMSEITQYLNNNSEELTNYTTHLKNIMKQNPDVIYINKLEDAVTAQEVFDIIASGKLVIAEMPINSLENIFSRLLKWGISNNEIAFNLRGIINQKLIKKVDNQDTSEGMLILQEILVINRNVQREIISSQNFLDLIDQVRKDITITFKDYGLNLVSQCLTTEEALNIVLKNTLY